MKRLLVVAAGLGLVLAVAIIAYEGFGAVTHALAAVGFGLIVVIVLRGVQVASAGLGWWIIFPPDGRSPPLHVCLWVRFIREANTGASPLRIAQAIVGGLTQTGRQLNEFFAGLLP